jgi:tRNA-2-methylthio-N6-dimethylallyladenosine synthase
VKRLFYIATMGCQMNEYDSDTLAQHLMNYGFDPTDNPDYADLIMINTCTVREKASQKAFSFLGRMEGLKKKRPDIILGIMGCIAQQEGAALLKRNAMLDLVLGTREVGNISAILDRVEINGERVVATDLSTNQITPSFTEGHFNGRLKAFISIVEGCNNFCTYCIVPFVRGREKSRPAKDILKLVNQLISQGVKEITLLGQNVNSYFSSEDNYVNFPSLLKKLSELQGLKRIRFTTSHPKDLSEELIECFKSLNNLCPHLHLPFQSGSDRVLKLMHRGYSAETYIKQVEKLRSIRPDLAITSDVMVGFPGETNEDFNMTLDLIEKIEFDNLFSFKYSDRKGTSAERMNEKISEDIKLYRLKILQEKQKNITLKKNKLIEGREVEVLVDGFSKRGGGQYAGRSPCNRIVNFNSDNNIMGSLVKVVIKKSYINSLQGVIID